LLWWIVYWRRNVDRLRVVIGLRISRSEPTIAIVIATPFLTAVIVAPVAPPPMSVVMISERYGYR
jgi:hypothetical protein